MVYRSGADPANLRLNCVQHREQAMPLDGKLIFTKSDSVAGLSKPLFVFPVQLLSQHGVNSRAFCGSGLRASEMKVHQSPWLVNSFSIRIAVALNSDVPDLGSDASMVRSLVAT